MENLKKIIAPYRSDINIISIGMISISMISFFITFLVNIIEKNKLGSEITPTQFNTVQKNIENTKITMYVFFGLIIFFTLILFFTIKY
jgi:hypothetical protein